MHTRPALLFRRVKGSPYPVVTNLFGTARRVQLAFGSRPRELLARAARLPETLLPPSLSRLWGHRDLLAPLLRTGTRLSGRGPVTLVFSDNKKRYKICGGTTPPTPHLRDNG